MRGQRLCAGVVLAVLAGPRLHAQDLPRLSRLADGVYAYEHADPTKAGVTANNLIVVSPAGVLVADGQGTDANTRELVAAVASVTTQPIRYVVVGSEHGDHRGGDRAFPPGVTFLVHPASAARLAKAGQTPAWGEGATVELVPGDGRTVALGGRDIRVLFLGRAHTGGDLAVYLPRERVAFLSEVFIDHIFPSMANGYPREWIDALRRAEAIDAAIVVSAHGRIGAPLSVGMATLTDYRMAVERVVAEGRRLREAGVPAGEAASRAELGAFRDWWRAADNAAGALRRVYADLEGTLDASSAPR